MIPDLPPSVSDGETLVFYDTLMGNLQDQSSIHVNWHTHRQNPSTCWICDMYALSAKMVLLCDKYITKPTLDIETELSSEDDSDSEIENDLNVNDEPEDTVESNEPE